MNHKILLLIFALMHFCSVSGQNKNTAWIESNFVDSIVYERKADGKYLFPIEGFQMENGKLFILTYNDRTQKRSQPMRPGFSSRLLPVTLQSNFTMRLRFTGTIS